MTVYGFSNMIALYDRSQYHNVVLLADMIWILLFFLCHHFRFLLYVASYKRCERFELLISIPNISRKRIYFIFGNFAVCKCPLNWNDGRYVKWIYCPVHGEYLRAKHYWTLKKNGNQIQVNQQLFSLCVASDHKIWVP